MPDFFTRARDFLTGNQKDTAPVNRYEGFTANGAVVLRDRRGTSKAEIPDVSEKGMHGMGDDPMAIYRPSGAKSIDASKAMGNFTGWTFAAVNAIASEVSNIDFRLYQIAGEDHDEKDDHPLLDLLEGVNEDMTGIELKYVTMAHLELTGNSYWLLDGVTDAMGQPRAIYPLVNLFTPPLRCLNSRIAKAPNRIQVVTGEPLASRGAVPEHMKEDPMRASFGTDARQTSQPTGPSIFPACHGTTRANSRCSASSPFP